MRRPLLLLCISASFTIACKLACAQSSQQDLTEVEKMISTLRDKQAVNQGLLQRLRDDTVVMVPFGLETREGKLITLSDFMSDPTRAQQAFNEEPGKHPTWIKNLTSQYVPIPKADFAQFTTSLAIMWYLELNTDTNLDIKKFARSINQFVQTIHRQSQTGKANTIASLEKQQSQVNSALKRLLDRRDALRLQVREEEAGGKPDASAPSKSGWNGTFATSWGDTVLRVSGGRMTGTFTHKDGKLEGELSADGRRITGKWNQAPTRTAPNDAGAVEFTLNADGKGFTGRWWYGFDTSKGADGGWNGSPK